MSLSQAHCASGMRGSARCRRSTSQSELKMLPDTPGPLLLASADRDVPGT